MATVEAYLQEQNKEFQKKPIEKSVVKSKTAKMEQQTFSKQLEPKAHDVLLASQHLLNLRNRRNDAFLQTDVAMMWRSRYFGRILQFVLKIVSLVNVCLIGMDDLFTCEDNLAFATSCTYSDPSPASVIIELVLVLVLGSGIFMQWKYKGPLIRSDLWLLFVSFTMITVAIALAMEPVLDHVYNGDKSVRAWVWCIRAMCRPVFVLHHFEGARDIFFRMGRVIPRVSAVIAVCFLFLVIFAVFARLLVLDTDFQGNQYGLAGNGFSSIYQSIITLFWWATGNNGPEPGNQTGAPGFKSGKFWGYYFVVYTVFQVFYVMQVVTATVYKTYGDLSDAAKIQQEESCKKSLFAAFKLLRVKVQGKSLVSPDSMHSVCCILADFEKGFEYAGNLSISKSGYDIESFEIIMVSHPTSYQVEEDLMDDEGASLQKLRHSLRSGVTSKLWERLLKVISLFNIIMILAFMEASMSSTKVGTPQVLHISVMFVYLLDLLVCLFAFGPIEIFEIEDKSVLARCYVTLFCIFMMTQHLVNASTLTTGVVITGSFLFLSMSVLHVFSILVELPTLAFILRVMFKVLPSLANLGVASFAIMYSWSVVGVMISGGNFTQTNPAVVAFDNGSNGPAFYTCNFNGVVIGIYTLFFAIYNNNIQSFTGGLQAAGGTLALVHFMIFYIYGLFILGNVVMSIILDVHEDASKNYSANAVVPDEIIDTPKKLESME